MKRIAIGLFKQTCLRLLEEVRQTGKPILVTKRGVPIAQVVPLPAELRKSWRGAMQGTGDFLDDLIGPAAEEKEWEVLRS